MEKSVIKPSKPRSTSARQKTSRYRPLVHELAPLGLTHREIAQKLGISESRVKQLSAEKNATLEEKKSHILNSFIRRRKLAVTAKELEAALEASMEANQATRAQLIGVKYFHLRNLTKRLPEFRLTEKQIVQRQLLRMHSAGEPIHSTYYMQRTNRNLIERARYLYGNYWLALEAIGIRARPTQKGKAFKTYSLPKEEGSMLEARLRGSSVKRIAGMFGMTLPDAREALARVKNLAGRRSRLGRKLDKLEKIDSQLENLETQVKSPREEVLERFKQGQPVEQIMREVGLTKKKLATNFRNLTREQKIEILKAAQERVKKREVRQTTGAPPGKLF